MSIEYDNYLEQHRSNVYKGYEWIRHNLPNLLVGVEGFICKPICITIDLKTI